MDYHKAMRRAVKLALKGRGRVSPNPRVGAVIVGNDGRVLGEGYHRHFGGPHAEAVALTACRERDVKGATLVVTLEPCCFYGKTPPCTAAILDAGISRVVAAMQDPNPLVNGQGFAELQKHGIDVQVGTLAALAGYINRGYISYFKRGRAWCAVKVAVSLDGKMANRDGQSKWITGPAARRLAHQLRADHDAVLVGGGTLRADDPELTVRLAPGSNPVRVILSPHNGIPKSSKIAQTASQVRTLLITTDIGKPEGYDVPGLEVIHLPGDKNGMINPLELLKLLPNYGVLSLLVEGGSSVLSSFMQADVVDEISVGVAPSVIGTGKAPFDAFLPSSWESRPLFQLERVRRLGDDVVLTYRKGDGLSLPA